MSDTGDPTGEPGSGDLGWRAQLPDDLKENEELAKFKSIGDLGSGFLSLKDKATDAVKIPDENTPIEEIEEFHIKCGRPQKSDGYELKPPKFPEGAKADEKLIDGFRKEAFNLQCTRNQAEGLFNWFNKQITNTLKNLIEARSEEKEKAIEALKKKWGKDFDKNMDLAKRAGKEFGDEKFIEAFEEADLMNDPLVAEFFYSVYQVMDEHKLIRGSATGGEMTKQEFLDQTYPSMKGK